MEKLAEILHELVDAAVLHPNRRGELHQAVEEATAPATPAGAAPEVADVTPPAVQG